MSITKEQIKYMVDRFLGWKLPANFSPDAGISFKAAFNEHTAHPMKHEPSGTNLFDVNQATAMVRYLVEGMPSDDPRRPAAGNQARRRPMTVRCKFVVSSKLETPFQTKEGQALAWHITMAAIWEGADSDGNNIAKENHIFSKATPSGELKMCITNEAAAAELKTGECYYMDFTPAGLPAFAKPKAA